MAAKKRTRRTGARSSAKRTKRAPAKAGSAKAGARKARAPASAKDKDKSASDGGEPQGGGPRAFWSGTITFGLVSVPVDLFPAVRSRRAPLRMLGPKDQPLRRRYYCSGDDAALSNEDIVRGYEWPDGSFTVVDDDELDSVAPRKSRDIDLQRFVKRDQIPPKLLERPYVLVPAGETTKAYHLLAETMEQSGRAGIATFVMRGREYLAAIFAEGGLLRAATMRFVEELRTPASIGLPKMRKIDAADRKDVEAALTKLKANDIDRDALDDDYTSALLELAEKKRAAKRDIVKIDEPEAQDDGGDMADVIDIMRVLKERLGAARAPAKSH